MVISKGTRKVLTNKLTYDNIYKDRGFVIVAKEGEKDAS